MLASFFEFYNPVKIVSGHKALDNLPYELDQLGVKRPVIITDQGVQGAGLIKMVINSFHNNDISVAAIYDETPPDSSNEVVNKVAQIYRDKQCDSIIAIGGGSPIDTAKGVNIVITEDSDDLIKFMGADVLKKPMQPFVVIPSTAGTGSEVTCAAVIANPKKNVKMSFTSSKLMPDVAILDPRMTMTCPPKITAATGMDALTHAMEAYVCLQKNPLSDAYAFKAIELVRAYLVKAVENGKDTEARFAMANAACMAGIAFSNSMVGAVHGLGHATGAVCHVPHGVAMSIFLPYGLEYNMSKIETEVAEMLLPFGGPDLYSKTVPNQRAAKTIHLIRDLQKQLFDLCQLPMTLKQAGVPEDQLEKIAETALGDGTLMLNPEELEYQDALKILKEAY